MKWFARGRVWDSPEQARWAGSNLEGTREKRGREWRPGGKHEDSRPRFDKRRKDSSRPGNGPGTAAPRADSLSTAKPATGPEQERQLAAKPAAEGQRPRSPKPPREGQRPWSPKPPRKEGQRPWSPKPPGEGQRPWTAKPPREGQRPWTAKPPREGQRPWSGKGPRLPQTQRPWTSESALKPGRFCSASQIRESKTVARSRSAVPATA